MDETAAEWVRKQGASAGIVDAVRAVEEGRPPGTSAVPELDLVEHLARVVVVATWHVRDADERGKPRPEAQYDAIRLHALASLRLLVGA